MELFFRRFGKGKPLIILHGLFGMSDNWVSLGRKFAEHFEVFIPDQRNHGKSPHSSQHNYFVLAEDLAEFIETHAIEQPYIIGHSMGGKTAMLHALEHPHQVEKIVVVDISPAPYELHHVDMIHAMIDIDFDVIRSRKDVDAKLSEKISSIRVRNAIMKNLYWVDKNRMAWKLNLQTINESIDDIVDGLQSTNTFEKPVLFIKGGNSNYLDVKKDLPLLQDLFPNADIKTIEHASHWIHADAPEEFYQIVMNFLSA